MSIPPLIAKFLIHPILYQIIRILFVNVKIKLWKLFFSFLGLLGGWKIFTLVGGN